MKAMVFSDLVTMKNSLVQLIGIMVLVGAFIVVATQTPVAGAAAIAAALPFMYLFSISAYDEMNGWEHFRLTLPLTRGQVVWGRYASMAVVVAFSAVLAICVGLAVVGVATAVDAFQPVPDELLWSDALPEELLWAVIAAIVIMMVAASIGMPCVMRFGLTKGTRMVPVVVMLIFACAAIGGTTTGVPNLVEGWIASLSAGSLALLGAGVFAGAVVLYAISAAIAVKLYERRPF